MQRGSVPPVKAYRVTRSDGHDLGTYLTFELAFHAGVRDGSPLGFTISPVEPRPIVGTLAHALVSFSDALRKAPAALARCFRRIGC